ncbi:hypothetical protein MRB53_036066 [Persea americana]|uniref:Uncharacterized protein n=1 Tax=Persea americana TaxID=3435 RepID=A0ACC2K6Y2_PERAE|nr:hypothetical protein MRB53_036066 [Persea americana]
MRLQKLFKDQGIVGPPYRVLIGNIMEDVRSIKEAWSKPMNLSHKIVPRVIPFIHQIVTRYGKTSLTWVGTCPRIFLLDAELIREVLSNKSGQFEQVKISPIVKFLISGLVIHEGEKWVRHRRIINPAFHLEKLKLMLPAFFTSSSELIDRWEKLVGPSESLELDVWPEFQNMTGDVISKTAFGSSYDEGTRILQLQTEQCQLLIDDAEKAYIPGYRFLPTKKNKRRKEIEKEVRGLLRGMIEKREKEMKAGVAAKNDLLGLLMESNSKDSQEQGNSKGGGMTIEDVIDECKLFYFAGQETTSVLLTWSMILLGMHLTWQTRAREEVLQVFGKNKPEFDGLNQLKIVTMILYEVLRLYPPVVVLARRACNTTAIGGLTIPVGAQVSLPTLLIHHDPKLWGEDADEFNPERFSEGVMKASKNQFAFFPFGWGPRICLGQNFALLETKLALSMILQHFSFELSPSYTHAPFVIITLQPQHGAQIILRKLSDHFSYELH